MRISAALSNSSSCLCASCAPTSSPPSPPLSPLLMARSVSSWRSKLGAATLLRNLTTPRASLSSTSVPWQRRASVWLGVTTSMSPCPSRSSAPFWSSTMRLSVPEATLNATRHGMFDLIRPVTTVACGRCVARIRWMPTARAFCAMRTIDCSTSLLVIMRSASSSITKTMYGIFFMMRAHSTSSVMFMRSRRSASPRSLNERMSRTPASFRSS